LRSWIGSLWLLIGKPYSHLLWWTKLSNISLVITFLFSNLVLLLWWKE
jgi:hypothetical protein